MVEMFGSLGVSAGLKPVADPGGRMRGCIPPTSI